MTSKLKAYKRFLGLKSEVYMTEETLLVFEKRWPNIRDRAKWSDEHQCWIVTT